MKSRLLSSETRLPLLLDGAMGTQLHRRGFEYGSCAEAWSLQHPEIVIDIQRAYVEAGSRIIYAPTFGANSAALGRSGLAEKTEEFNLALVELSKRASDGRALVAGDIAPSGLMPQPFGTASDSDFEEVFVSQAAALEKAGVDLFVVETQMYLQETFATVKAVKSVSDKPILVSFTCSDKGFTLLGEDVADNLKALMPLGIDGFGLNCSVGPEGMLQPIKRLHSAFPDMPLIAKPNAGLPKNVNGESVYDMEPELFASFAGEFAANGVSFIGGCCGTDERYIAELKKALKL